MARRKRGSVDQPIGVGLTTIGAGIGIGLIGANAMTAIARQPDAQPKIFTTMLIIAALVEVIALVGALVALLVLNDSP